jgi:hypothetical protein
LAWVLGESDVPVVEEVVIFLSSAKVKPLLLAVEGLELVVEEMEIYFILHISKFPSSSTHS